MADQASEHRRRVPLKAAREPTAIDESGPKAKSKAKSKSKAKRKKQHTTLSPGTPVEQPDVADVGDGEVDEQAPTAEPSAAEAPKRGWRRFNVRWGVVAVIGPALVLTPIVLTWAVLAVFGPMAGYAAATVKTVRDDRVWSVLCGLFLGVATVAAMAVVVIATLEGMARRRARTLENEHDHSATAFALLAAAAAGFVATPIALFFGSSWLSARAASGTDIGRLFTELDLSRSTMRSWVIAGVVLATVAAIWAARTGHMESLKARTAKAFDEWADAKYDHEINPDKW